MAERSIKTLCLRVRQQNIAAGKIAAFLEGHTKVAKVYYPGLTSHLGHAIAKSQMMGFGGMITFEILGSGKQANHMLEHLSIITPAISLGGVESLISSPAATSHRDLSAEDRQSKGISEAMLRLSVGIENEDDLIQDLSFALSKI